MDGIDRMESMDRLDPIDANLMGSAVRLRSPATVDVRNITDISTETITYEQWLAGKTVVAAAWTPRKGVAGDFYKGGIARTNGNDLALELETQYQGTHTYES